MFFLEPQICQTKMAVGGRLKLVRFCWNLHRLLRSVRSTIGLKKSLIGAPFGKMNHPIDDTFKDKNSNVTCNILFFVANYVTLQKHFMIIFCVHWQYTHMDYNYTLYTISWILCKLVIPSRFILWNDSFSEISRKCILPNQIWQNTLPANFRKWVFS